MAEKRDYYEVMGVPKNASEADIKAAYRKLAKQYHPDLHPNDPEAEAKFKEVSEAYEVLSDEQKRAHYDQFGHEDPTAGYGGYSGGFTGGFGGFEDIIDNIFGGFGSSSQRRNNGPVRGNDLRVDLRLTFQDAFFGAKKDINVFRSETCEDCHGSGARNGTSPETCPVCHGTGVVTQVTNTMLGRMQTQRDCSHCHGTGKIISNPCSKCSGTGTVRRSRKMTVTIPAGIDDGQALTLRGEGEPGLRGGPNGDLYVYISVASHPVFKRRNNDLECDVHVSFADAALGGQIKIPTMNGDKDYKLNEGTQPDYVVRLKGQGVPYIRGSGAGDLLAKVKVDIPRKMTSQQKEALRAFDELMTGRANNTGRKDSLFNKVKDKFGA
ncbi:MAG: molecular chaperone DnaJ [Clostridia bacterium]|nr:molecular chaperone DnaJ [Clostridia bacterium]